MNAEFSSLHTQEPVIVLSYSCLKLRYSFTLYLLKSIFVLSSNFAPGSPKWCLPVTFVTKIFYESFNFLNELLIFGHFYTPHGTHKII